MDITSPEADRRRIPPTRVALALSGGALRGAAHVGVLRVLEREGIVPDIVVGTSIGAIVGAAYVAGEDLTLNFNQGLFDMSIDVGTGDANGIVHTGSTTGESNVTSGDNHTIYMVAVPKNSAVEMLLSGTIGFDEAAYAEAFG